MITRLLLFLAFMGLSLSGYSQYGRLEPLKEGDTTYMVMRTPKETLKKFDESNDKKIRRMGDQIETIERNLDLWRADFILNRTSNPNMMFFIKTLKSLEEQGVVTNNYVQEALLYTGQKRGAY